MNQEESVNYHTQLDTVYSFIEWKNSLKKEIRGNILMFDVPSHYKWLNENELFNYYHTKLIK